MTPVGLVRDALVAVGFRSVDEVAAFLTLVSMIAAACAFIFGWQKYKTAQHWKRKEFVASEMKEFFEDWQVANALLMIDWSVRDIVLTAPAEDATHKATQVTRQLQISALRPHRLLRDPALNKAGTFTSAETAIRDTYDSLLDRLERFGAYLDSELVSVDDLRPYLKYWINDVASTAAGEDGLQWTLAFLTYIHFYDFDQTVLLFSKFGKDISVGGPIWNALKAQIVDQEFVARLEQTVKR